MQEAADKVDTVFTVEVITKVTQEGAVPIKALLEESGFWYSINTKNNLGLGLPAYDFYGEGDAS